MGIVGLQKNGDQIMVKRVKEFDDQLLDNLIQDCTKPGEVFGDEGLFKRLQKALLERMLEGELTHELGYQKHATDGHNTGNSRNGYSKKTLKGEIGELDIQVPRDRNSSFEPQIIQKNQTRFDGFDDKIIALYARGMTTRDIQAQLQELYGVEVSPSLISEVTEEVMEEVKTWQSRPLDRLYPVVFLDALVIKVREDNKVINKAFYLALGINTDGHKELLGIWISKNEGAKFWLGVLTELKNRGLEDIFIACVDGLTGFPDAIEAVYPKTKVQLCIVHMVRNSLKYVSWQSRKEVAKDLKAIYGSSTVEEAEMALEAFAQKWDDRYPTIAKSWRTHWINIIPFFDYTKDIRRAIYTTNAIESLNSTLRKYIKNKRVFPSDDAALKQLYLALRNISKKWTMPIQNWKQAMNSFSIMFGDRL
jgi:putative transposase